MLLSAMLLAAALQAAPPATIQTSRGPVEMGRVTYSASEREAVEAVTAREACRASGLQLADQPAPNVRAKAAKLGDLPPANHTLTVLRSVDGCPVSSTVRFNVDRPAGR